MRHGQHGVHDVADEGEVPSLFAVANHGQRLAGHELCQEHSENGAVGTAGACAWPVDVEEAQRDRGKPVDGRPMHDELLAQILGKRIGVTGISRRNLRCGIVVRDPVTGRRGCVDEPVHLLLAGCLQYGKRTVHIGPEIGLRLPNRGHDVRPGGKVEDAFHARHGRGHGRFIGYVPLDDVEARIALVPLEIAVPSDLKAVEHAYPAAVRNQPIDQMASDKSRTAGDQIKRHQSTHPCRLPSLQDGRLQRN